MSRSLQSPRAFFTWAPCLAGLLLLPLVGCKPRPPAAPTPAAFSAEGQAALDRLLQLMKERLLLMHDVARTKWNDKKPITDPDREQALLDTVAREGQRHGLEPAFTRAFFQAQMDAGKRIQEADFQQWQAQAQPPFPDVPALPTLRRQLDEMNRDLLTALGAVAHWQGEQSFHQAIANSATRQLAGEGIDEAVRRLAIEPLEQE